MNFILAQIAGALVSVTAVILYQQKRKEGVIIGNGIISIFEGIQYFLLWALSGAFISVVNLGKNVILYVLHKKDKKVPLWLAITFVLATVGGGLLGWEGWLSLLPIVGVSVYTLIMCQEKMSLIRWGNLIISSTWLVYALLTSAYAGAVGLGIEVISAIIALIRNNFIYNKKA